MTPLSTPISTPTSARIAVCDARSASIFSAHLEWPARLHLDQLDRIESPWRDFHEHHRPSRLGMGPKANAAQHFADEHHEPEEMSRRFARQVAEWIRTSARREPPLLAVFAATRFLGDLRDALGARGGGPELFRGELCGLHASEVAAHPAVHGLLMRALAPTPPLVPSRSGNPSNHTH